VHTIGFDSANPFDHVCRALDVIRKMGFAFVAMRVDRKADDTFRVSIEFSPRGELTAATLVERMSLCVGVSDVTHDMSCARCI
jgi:acetolactate synthase regulatory subunit